MSRMPFVSASRKTPKLRADFLSLVQKAKFGLISRLSKDEEWGRRDLNPDRRVSPTRGATHACCCEPWVSAPVCHHRNQQTRFAIKPMTGARNSTRLNYVPMGLRGRGTAAGISKFASRGIDQISSEGVVHFGHGTAALAPVALASSLAVETGHSRFASRAGAVLTDLPSQAIRTCAFVRDLPRYSNQRPFSGCHEISGQREESEPCSEGAAFQDPGLRDVRILGRDDQRSLEQLRRQRSIDVVRHDLPPNRGLPHASEARREARDSARERETLSERLRPPIDHDAGIAPDDRLVSHDDGPPPPGTMKREPLILTVGKEPPMGPR